MDNTKENNQILTEEQTLEILTYCAEKNPAEFNFNKAIEEATEFVEVLVKLQTKHNPKRPNEREALKEYGDLFYRGLIALKTIFPDKSFKEIEDDVDAHIAYKLNKLIEYKESGKYKGGL